MNKILLNMVLFCSTMLVVNAHAATASGTFNVNINLASACEISTVPAADFTYTSFQKTAATFSSSFDLRCTNTLPISSIALDNLAVTDAATNLSYTLALGTAPTVGTGVAQTVAITGTMPGDQAGTCATATCSNAGSANRQRTLTVSY